LSLHRLTPSIYTTQVDVTQSTGRGLSNSPQDRATAERVERLGRAANTALNEALIVIQENCATEEFIALRRVVGQIMGSVVVDLLQPLYREHPEAIPPELRKFDRVTNAAVWLALADRSHQCRRRDIGPSCMKPVAILVALVLVACGPWAPNADLVNACRHFPNWRARQLSADVILISDHRIDGVPSTKTEPANASLEAAGFCIDCARLVLRGFASVEYLPEYAIDANRVARYALSRPGDPRCISRLNQEILNTAAAAGTCITMERYVPRTARFAMDRETPQFDGRGMSIWTYRLLDLQNFAVLARAEEPHQIGVESPIFGCADVGIDRASARDFVEQSVVPERDRLNGRQAGAG
jgi:hypothetical protein